MSGPATPQSVFMTQTTAMSANNTTTSTNSSNRSRNLNFVPNHHHPTHSVEKRKKKLGKTQKKISWVFQVKNTKKRHKRF